MVQEKRKIKSYRIDDNALIPYFLCSTLMKALANYTLPGLIHMKILLVDQHVEGDDDTPLEWLLRADVERTALLDDEKKINMLLESRDSTKHDANSFNNTLKDIDAEFVGVNLEVALEECYERMEIIGKCVIDHILCNFVEI